MFQARGIDLSLPKVLVKNIFGSITEKTAQNLQHISSWII